MARATKLFAATTVVGVATSIWLYVDNRSLRSDLDDAREASPVAAVTEVRPEPAKPPADMWLDAKPKAATAAGPLPALPDSAKETRMDRRARRTEEFAAMFGRQDGESEDDYKARILPLIKLGLAGPRDRVAEMRKLAEEKAHVTAAQSAQLDKAFDKIYDDVLDYTNKAVADGQLSPYERNVAGWLDFAGGLGGILTNANGQIGKILDANQLRIMYESGFEWGEYLGLNAPWERLNAPPPRKH